MGHDALLDYSGRTGLSLRQNHKNALVVFERGGDTLN